MNLTYAMQGAGIIEGRMGAAAVTIDRLDTLLPVEAPSKAGMLMTSDCCGSNNYPPPNDA